MSPVTVSTQSDSELFPGRKGRGYGVIRRIQKEFPDQVYTLAKSGLEKVYGSQRQEVVFGIALSPR